MLDYSFSFPVFYALILFLNFFCSLILISLSESYLFLSYVNKTVQIPEALFSLLCLFPSFTE